MSKEKTRTNPRKVSMPVPAPVPIRLPGEIFDLLEEARDGLFRYVERDAPLRYAKVFAHLGCQDFIDESIALHNKIVKAIGGEWISSMEAKVRSAKAKGTGK
jgi:hypothetical protein